MLRCLFEKEPTENILEPHKRNEKHYFYRKIKLLELEDV